MAPNMMAIPAAMASWHRMPTLWWDPSSDGCRRAVMKRYNQNTVAAVKPMVHNQFSAAIQVAGSVPDCPAAWAECPA